MSRTRTNCWSAALAALLILGATGIGEPGDSGWADRYSLGGDFAEANHMALKGNRLFVAGRARNTEANSSVDSVVRAYDVRNGNELWTATHDVAAGSDSAHGIAVKGSRVVFAAGEFAQTTAQTVRRAEATDVQQQPRRSEAGQHANKNQVANRGTHWRISPEVAPL